MAFLKKVIAGGRAEPEVSVSDSTNVSVAIERENNTTQELASIALALGDSKTVAACTANTQLLRKQQEQQMSIRKSLSYQRFAMTSQRNGTRSVALPYKQKKNLRAVKPGDFNMASSVVGYVGGVRALQGKRSADLARAIAKNATVSGGDAPPQRPFVPFAGSDAGANVVTGNIPSFISEDQVDGLGLDEDDEDDPDFVVPAQRGKTKKRDTGLSLSRHEAADEENGVDSEDDDQEEETAADRDFLTYDEINNQYDGDDDDLLF
eukprot:scpid61800/ scgid11988/ 